MAVITTYLPAVGFTAVLASLAQVPTPDPIEPWSKYGLSGLLIIVVVALWKDGKNEMKVAQDRRDKKDAEDQAYRERRESMENARMEKFLESLAAINASLEEGQNKCSMTNYLLGQLRKKKEGEE